jgi:hypothetical protein
MAQNGLAIARAAHVKLKSISAVLQRKVEGGKGVFSRIPPRAAMPEQ